MYEDVSAPTTSYARTSIIHVLQCVTLTVRPEEKKTEMQKKSEAGN